MIRLSISAANWAALDGVKVVIFASVHIPYCSNTKALVTASSQLTQFKRLPDRGSHDRAAIDAILDAGYVAHVGFIRDGHPAVIPTLYVRRDDHILIHGSPASAPLRAAKSGASLCITVTQLDGLVLARSAFHHSANYRSAVVYGEGRWLSGEEHSDALDTVIDRIAPGRRPYLRPPTRNEVAGTAVVAIPLDEASAKVRSGPPGDDEADYLLPIWAGVIPIEVGLGEPVPDPRNLPGVELPPHVAAMSW